MTVIWKGRTFTSGLAISENAAKAHVKDRRIPIAYRRVGGMLLAALLGLAAFLLTPGLTLAARQTLAIFAVVITLWVTEAIPLFATAMLLVFMEVTILGLEGGSLGLTGLEYRIFLQPFFDPSVVLMLGGFALSVALSKYGMDVRFTSAIIRLLPATPGAVLAGFMIVTAVLSMWMSNTAATALMLAILTPALRNIAADDPLRSGLVLSIPFAANLGGMITPVGTPPNAIALGALNRIGEHVTFLNWMTVATPLVIVLLVVTWFLLLRVFPPKSKKLQVTLQKASPLAGKDIIIIAVLVLTLALWLTTDLHGIPEGVVAFIPIIVFFGSRILDNSDVSALGWDVLMIIGGGLSLSVAFQQSGLSDVLVGFMHSADLPSWGLVLLVAGVSVMLSTVVSHTAAISFLMPIVVSIGGPMVAPMAVAAALASSTGLGLPVSNAPNTLAYSTGLISVGKMARCGFTLSVLGTTLAVVVTLLLRNLLS